MTIDERIEALAMNLELVSPEIQGLRKLAAEDGENPGALASIAEIHERRISAIEGQEPEQDQ